MNNKQLLLTIGAVTASICLSMQSKNGLISDYEHGAVLESESYEVAKLNNDKYYYTDGKTYELMIGDEIITFKNNKLNILESDSIDPQLMVRKKVNMVYPFSKDNPDIYDEYTLVVPKGYAYFADEIK